MTFHCFLHLCAARAIIGELDEAVDSQLDLAVMKGEPLRPLVH
jgi:hypothetical protein